MGRSTEVKHRSHDSEVVVLNPGELLSFYFFSDVSIKGPLPRKLFSCNTNFPEGKK